MQKHRFTSKAVVTTAVLPRHQRPDFRGFLFGLVAGIAAALLIAALLWPGQSQAAGASSATGTSTAGQAAAQRFAEDMTTSLESKIKQLVWRYTTPSYDPAWTPLVLKLAKDGFDQAEMEALFAKLGSKSWSPAFMAAKVKEIYKAPGIKLTLSEDALPELPEDYEPPLSVITVAEYKAFTKKYATELADIKKKYGVPSNVLVGLLLVETGLGSNLGRTPALLALASMALTDTPELLGSNGNEAQIARVKPAALQKTLRQKSAWAYKELKALIAYGRDHQVDISKIPGSVYGAIGISQFMPSNISAYGVDGDKDGVINLFSVVDAMYSTANFLKAHGWKAAKTQQRQAKVIMAYNQSRQYAKKVLGVSNKLLLAQQGKLAGHRNPLA